MWNGVDIPSCEIVVRDLPVIVFTRPCCNVSYTSVELVRLTWCNFLNTVSDLAIYKCKFLPCGMHSVATHSWYCRNEFVLFCPSLLHSPFLKSYLFTFAFTLRGLLWPGAVPTLWMIGPGHEDELAVTCHLWGQTQPSRSRSPLPEA